VAESEKDWCRHTDGHSYDLSMTVGLITRLVRVMRASSVPERCWHYVGVSDDSSQDGMTHGGDSCFYICCRDVVVYGLIDIMDRG